MPSAIDLYAFQRRPELQNPGGTIEVLGPDHYHIEGVAVEGSREIRWNLDYQRRLDTPWLPWVLWPVPYTMGILPAWINYHMQMPDAVVNGTFYVRDGAEETTYVLSDARGYHDGFFSKFVFSMFEWDWLDYKQENLSIHLLHPHAPAYSCEGGWTTCTPGNLRVVYDDGTTIREYNFYRGRDVSEKQIWINYDALAVDPAYPDVQYPTEETIIAMDPDGNQLSLHWSLARYMIVYYDVPDPFFDTVTFEIVADFWGSFYEAASGTRIPISGPGWADWSGPAFPGG